MSKEAVLRLKSTLLFKSLLIKEANEGLDNKLSSKVEAIVGVVSELLKRIPENMPEYTLHDSNHSAKIIEIIGKFLPDKTLKHLNSVEISLLILSAYLHDVGMTASKDEKENIIANDVAYKILFKTLDGNKEKYDNYLSIGDHRSATFIEDQIFTEYLRRNHVTRSAEYIGMNLKDGKLEVEIDGIPFWKHLISICNGHGEPVSAIKNTKLYPNNTLVGEKIINVQFLTLVLRLGDILDLDPERTPKIIYEFANPKDPVSIIEWKKHRSIIGYSISPNKILFEAECSLPEVERALKQFMGWIEIERKQTMQLLEDYNQPSLLIYKLNLNEEILTERIRSDGSYLYNDLKFEIGYQRVLELLMGQRLYRSTTFALRELLQNSNDAITARQEMYAGKDEIFNPEILLIVDDTTITIEDNGIGMDLLTFKDYFLQIGKSYYSSPAFYSKHNEIDVTSEFGIGVLSVFMIATSLIVESRKEPEDPINPSKPILFEIPTAHSYTIQRNSNKITVGTKITLKLKSQKPFKTSSINNILSQLIPHPKFPITVLNKGFKSVHEKKLLSDILKIPPYNEITDFQDYKFDDLDYENKIFFTHSFLEIDFTKSNNPILKNILGKLQLVNSGIYNWESRVNGIFSQRNFAVGIVTEEDDFLIEPTDNITNLFPRWLTYYSTLNFTKSSCLSITPDRTDLIVDEKYEMLRNLIDAFIIEELKTHFNEFFKNNDKNVLYSYIDFLIASGYIGLDSRQVFGNLLSNDARDFLEEFITFPIVTIDNQYIRMPAKEIMKKATISHISYPLNEDHIKQLSPMLSIPDFIMINRNQLKHSAGWSHRIEPFLYNLLVGGKAFAPHTVLTSMLPLFKIEAIKINNLVRQSLEHTFCHNILDSIESTDKILCFPRQNIEMYMTLNASHRILVGLIDSDGKLKKHARRITNKIQNILSGNIEDSIKRIGLNDDLYLAKVFPYGDRTDYYFMISGLLIKDNQFLPSLNNSLSNLWDEMISFDLINALNKDQFILTNDDFPKFWLKSN
ncbi:hypothetical protein FO440_07050 [Mucilaginibacter corticis]|uniref:HD-CE domain-containing protein n=1 Tax=Mucilaginibacter corticis TaxID=2597670 RepID=A0A556MVN7_9SPHI|nr:ATP-binding protein [Mucilaginibacter corticis]TSJ43932.1 hypothetical protein FO440_07050 [Mucilaginibacter corticis]